MGSGLKHAGPLVLAVDDEPGILRMTRMDLEERGFRVITAPNGEEALRVAEDVRLDVILLDVMMPEMTGLEVMRRLRKTTAAPIILVTALDGDRDKVRGLDLGADDYIVKPFSLDELSARIRAVLRRAGVPQSAQTVLAGDIAIDLERRLVTRAGEPLSLTRTEWLLLQILASNHGKVMLNSELLTNVWGLEYRDEIQYLRVWISRLRAKIEPDPSSPSIVKTWTGVGYMFVGAPVGPPGDAGSSSF